MQEVSVIIPNYNGMAYLEGVLSSLEQQAFQNFETILVDNGSSDGSVAFVMGNFPWVHIVELPDNFGFSRAVNEGIYASRTPYVLLLNNDTEVDKNFVGEMLASIKRHKKAFSCSARMICYHDRNKLDDAGNYYSALGWAYARGKGKDIHSFEKEGRIFASCAGAAIYRKKVLRKSDILMKSILHIWKILMWAIVPGSLDMRTWYVPAALVYHVGSGTSGSRYNQFKTRYSSRNNIYLIYKNMPVLQIILNLPFLVPGFGMKILFFPRREWAGSMWQESKMGSRSAAEIKK
ncbi:MAG: glycosyltransferase family 2 protein [Ruminococcus sp.]